MLYDEQASKFSSIKNHTSFALCSARGETFQQKSKLRVITFKLDLSTKQTIEFSLLHVEEEI